MLKGLFRRLLVRSIMTGLRWLLRLPSPVLRVLAGRPVVVDGRQPVVSARVLMRVARLAPFDAPHHNGSLERARAELNLAGALAGAGVCPGVRTSGSSWPGPGGPLPLRRYEPAGVPAPGPGLVYFHGGGFVLGSLDTHEGACRLLAEEAGVRVVSIGYRLAPEHPFPAAASDAVAAFAYVSSHAAEFGIDPARLAVGGDSSGGNLAAVVAHAGARGEVPRPAFGLLLTPATDALGESESHRQFGTGFRLDRDEWAWYRAQYLRDPAEYTDPRASVLYDDALDSLPPTYVATCGFDLLRDEGEAYARKLADAGVPVVHRRHEGQLHGFANRVGVDPDAHAAMLHAAGVLRAGLALTGRGRETGF
ncbi:alpha/beta hydrolase [Amycolatopsis australiensis]|uniref:Acetyl esterase n=1 Tax=Amycolatopsis australiensis TaxID=546364 RepID=A0A1K1SYA8_9PSEU|nr:alpha/beta hydrolase [Amycolatopsis australiensis]SFW89314.1 acetyl esterase [Amycolatopsis australiensis]